MNNPYPSAATLRAEQENARLVHDQEDAVQAFRTALKTFTTAFDKIYFPLGTPVAGYDLADIDAILADLSLTRMAP